MNPAILKTYKFYTQDGKRLAIFAVPVNAKFHATVFYKIYKIECSEKDQFDKNIANIALSTYLESPKAAKNVLKVKVVHLGRISSRRGESKKVFLSYCRENFCTMGKIDRACEVPVLFKNRVPVKFYEKQTRWINKLSHPLNK